jgi:hypothetical protein
MDRLIKRIGHGIVMPKSMQLAMERLAAYEDTALEPDEIPHWIPVSERLPETDETNSHKFDVLVYVPKRDGCHQSGYFIGKLHKVEADNTGNTNFWGVKTPGSEWTLWGWSYFEKPIPSHWMSLPQSPIGGKL